MLKKTVGALSIIFASLYADYPVTMSSTVEEVRTYLGTQDAKLVFVDFSTSGGVLTKKLKYINFAEGTGTAMVFHTIAAAVTPTAPVFSPDGNWVVFASAPSTYGENGATTSKVSAYICKVAESATPVLVRADSGYEPRFVQNSSKLTVIYSTFQPDRGYKGPGRTLTVEIDTTGGVAKVGTPQVLVANGGYNGGLSWDKRYVASGGGMGAMLDLQSGKTTPDTIGWNYSGQGCNISISTSRILPNAIMYLDFGALQAFPDIMSGIRWGMWQVLWVTDNTNKWRRCMLYPKTPKTPYLTADSSFTRAKWHHPEWSNHPYYAVSAVICERSFPKPVSGWYNTAEQERVHLINLKDNTNLELMHATKIEYRGSTADGFYWPGLWVEVPNGFTEEATWLNQTPVRRGMVGHKAVKYSFDGHTIATKVPMKKITIHNALGEVLGTINIKDRISTSLDISSSIASVAGIYFIRVETTDGAHQVFRYIPQK